MNNFACLQILTTLSTTTASYSTHSVVLHTQGSFTNRKDVNPAPLHGQLFKAFLQSLLLSECAIYCIIP